MRNKVLALLAMFVSIFTLAACGDSHGVSSSKNPSSLIGEWHQVNSNPNGWMTASISGESIQVNLHGRDSSSIFWMGSFDTSKPPVGKFKVVSLGDQDAMMWKIAASKEKQKTFAYNNGDLSFEFSVAGTSTTIHMNKTKSMPTLKPSRTATKTPTFNRPKAQTPTRTSKPAAPKVASPPKVSATKKKW